MNTLREAAVASRFQWFSGRADWRTGDCL